MCCRAWCRRFVSAGALSPLVPQASIRYLGSGAAKWVSYPAAAGAGSLLALCFGIGLLKVLVHLIERRRRLPAH